MATYAARRIAQFIPTMLVVSILVFAMVRAIPGDAAQVLLGPQASTEQVDALAESMGLNRPVWTQYGLWIGDVLQGDFGNSWINRFPVADLIRMKVGATVALAVGSLLVAIAIAVPVGILGALHSGSWIGRVTSLYTSIALGIPTFWLGILLILLFSLRLKWLPPSGYVPITEEPTTSLKMLVLPSFTLGIYLSAIFARFIKAAVIDVLRQDFVRTAYAKGLRQRSVVTQHVLKNALIPVITIFGIHFGGLLTGAVIVETIFGWPGLGRLLVTSIASRDYAVVQSVILLASLAFLVANLITDLTYGLLDPRIRAS
jgi:peptide/nickel transport system permease protein